MPDAMAQTVLPKKLEFPRMSHTGGLSDYNDTDDLHVSDIASKLEELSE